MRIRLFIALTVSVLAGSTSVALSDPTPLLQLHGYPPPPAITVRDPFTAKGPYFAEAAELVHIGRISLTAKNIICKMPPCYRPIMVRVNGQPVGFRGERQKWFGLVLDEHGNRIISGRSFPFARLWRDNATYTFLVQKAQAPASMPQTIEIVNRSGQLWRGVYITTSAQDHWGRDLASSTIKSGERFSTPLKDGSCLYDIRVELDSGDHQLLMGVDVCASSTVSVTRNAGQRINPAPSFR